MQLKIMDLKLYGLDGDKSKKNSIDTVTVDSIIEINTNMIETL